MGYNLARFGGCSSYIYPDAAAFDILAVTTSMIRLLINYMKWNFEDKCLVNFECCHEILEFN